MVECRNRACGRPAAQGRKGYCIACYGHQRRHGIDRPAVLVQREYDRAIAQILDEQHYTRVTNTHRG